MKLLANLDAIVRTTGIALFLALVCSMTILGLSPTDSGQRGFGNGAVNAVQWLYLLWAAAAIIAVVLRRRFVMKGFWLVFTINMLIVGWMVADYLVNR